MRWRSSACASWRSVSLIARKTRFASRACAHCHGEHKARDCGTENTAVIRKHDQPHEWVRAAEPTRIICFGYNTRYDGCEFSERYGGQCQRVHACMLCGVVGHQSLGCRDYSKLVRGAGGGERRA